jgi:hypothetical protein
VPRKKAVSIQVVEEAEGRFVVLTFADGEVVREMVDLKKKATRRPRRPQARITAHRMDRTRKKTF